jgi:hypothetical protein
MRKSRFFMSSLSTRAINNMISNLATTGSTLRKNEKGPAQQGRGCRRAARIRDAVNMAGAGFLPTIRPVAELPRTGRPARRDDPPCEPRPSEPGPSTMTQFRDDRPWRPSLSFDRPIITGTIGVPRPPGIDPDTERDPMGVPGTLLRGHASARCSPPSTGIEVAKHIILMGF